MPHTLGGDLLRLLAHGGISTAGNLVTHAIETPLLAKQQLEKGEKLENYKMLMNSAALTDKPEELQAIHNAMVKLGGPGLPQIGGSAQPQQQSGPVRNMVQKLLPGLAPPPEPQAQAAGQFLKPQKNLDQILANAALKDPEIAKSLVQLKYGMQPKAGEILHAGAAQAAEQGRQARFDTKEEREAKHQQVTEQFQALQTQIHALQAQTAQENAQTNKKKLDILGGKVNEVAEKAALDRLNKVNEDYLKVLTVGGKQEAKVAAADQFNSTRDQIVKKFPHLEDSLPPKIPVENVSVEHFWNKLGIGSPTTQRQVLKPGTQPSGEAVPSAQAETKPKVKSKGKTFIIYEDGDPSKPHTVDEETFNKVKSQEGK